MSLAETVIGWLAPPVCVGCGEEGQALCAECEVLIQPYGERCFRCGSLSPGLKTCASCRVTGSPGKVIISTIHEGLARELLRTYKFDQQRVAADSIARLMAAACNSADLNGYLIVPVPTATSRVRERGFDHSALLALKLSSLLNLKCASLLKRVGQSRQVGSLRSLRLTQMYDAFRPVDSRQAGGKNILLVDDVVTTGSTLSAASRALRTGGANRVDALVFAKRL
jgi:ComF family protein